MREYLYLSTDPSDPREFLDSVNKQAGMRLPMTVTGSLIDGITHVDDTIALDESLVDPTEMTRTFVLDSFTVDYGRSITVTAQDTVTYEWVSITIATHDVTIQAWSDDPAPSATDGS